MKIILIIMFILSYLKEYELNYRINHKGAPKNNSSADTTRASRD